MAYEVDGKRHEYTPYHQSDFHKAVPIYEELKGWNTPLTDVTEPDQLPAACAEYLKFLAGADRHPDHVRGHRPRPRSVRPHRVTIPGYGRLTGRVRTRTERPARSDVHALT